MPERKCTDEQILEFIKDYHLRYGWSPTVREIGQGVGLESSNTVQKRLLRLAEEGKIVYKGVRQIRLA